MIIYKIRESKPTSETSMYNNTIVYRNRHKTFHWYCLYHKPDVQSYQSNYVVQRSHNEIKFDKNGFKNPVAWWRHQLETFSALLAICAGKSPVPSEFPTQRPVMRSFYIFFDLRLNKRLSKQSWAWCFETLSRPLWRHCIVFYYLLYGAILATHERYIYIGYFLYPTFARAYKLYDQYI